MMSGNRDIRWHSVLIRRASTCQTGPAVPPLVAPMSIILQRTCLPQQEAITPKSSSENGCKKPEPLHNTSMAIYANIPTAPRALPEPPQLVCDEHLHSAHTRLRGHVCQPQPWVRNTGRAALHPAHVDRVLDEDFYGLRRHAWAGAPADRQARQLAPGGVGPGERVLCVVKIRVMLNGDAHHQKTPGGQAA